MEKELKQYWGPDKPLGDHASSSSRSPKQLFLPAERSHTEYSFWSTSQTTGLRFPRYRISNSGSTKRQAFATPVPNWGLWQFRRRLRVAAPLPDRDCTYEDSNQCISSQIMQACRGQLEHAQQVSDAKRGISPLLVFCDNSLTIRREALTSAFWKDYPCTGAGAGREREREMLVFYLLVKCTVKRAPAI